MGVEYAKHLLSQVRIEIREYVAQLQADLKHAQKMNKELRQRASAEQQEKRYAGLVAQAQYWGQQAEDAQNEADELRTDAQRYRKLVRYLVSTPKEEIIASKLISTSVPSRIDSIVDELPDPSS